MWKKVLVCLIALLAISSVGFTLLNGSISATGYITNTPHGGVASSLHTGDEIRLGTADDDMFIVLGHKNGYVYFLKKNPYGNDAVSYTDAETNAKNFANADQFGTVGSAHFSLGSNVGLITKSDLNDLGVVSQDQLISSIPTTSEDWWLGDKDVENNRAGFVSEDNSLVKTNSITSTVLNDGVCDVTSKTEVGVLPIKEIKEERIPIGKEVYSATIKIKHSGGSLKRTLYTGKDCTGSTAGSASISGATYAYDYYKETNGRERWTRSSSGVAVTSLIVENGWRPRVIVDKNGNTVSQNNSASATRIKGECYNFYENNNEIYADGVANGSGRSYKITSATGTLTASIQGFTDVGYRYTYCDGQINPAGSALVRPYVKIKESDVLMRNTHKRAYATSSQLSAEHIPESENVGNFLTLQTSVLSIALDNSKNGVYGNTYEIAKPKSGTVLSLPLTFGSSKKEGNRYVSAEAVDKDGNTVYSVLSAVGEDNTANVELDYANLLKPDTSSFKVTLYLEDSGIGNTSYRSQGTEITVYLKEPQSIRFDADTPSSVTYGDQLTVWAELYDFDRDSDNVIKQSKSALTFGLVADSEGKTNAWIVKQEYDFATGRAYAVIVPSTGTGTFTLKINKDKDSSFFAAEEKTLDFRLEKRELKLVPSINTTAVVGDRMSSLYPDVVCGSLVNGDEIPSALYPHLEPEQDGFASHPSDDGKFIAHPGTWKQLFPDLSDSSVLNAEGVEAFLNQYELEFEDYQDDPKYIFMVDPDGIPDSWIEINPPEPNGNNGWYTSNVRLSPSKEAKAFGYFEIALIENGSDGDFGSEVVLSKDTTGIRPTVKLKKKDSEEISKAKQIGTRIKIDKEKPIIETINIPSGWVTTSKQIKIQASDKISGIDSVKVSYKNASGNNEEISVTNTGGGSFQFDAMKNGTYVFTVMDKAGNKQETTRAIQGIDTAGSIEAILADNASDEGDTHDITVNTEAPASGIEYIDVYYREDGSQEYRKIGGLNPGLTTQVYQAQMNGDYKFEMVVGSGKRYSDEVSVVDITKNGPVVGIKVTTMETKAEYHPNTWVNQDVKITLSNTNVNFTEPVTYQYRKTSDHDWIDMSDNTMEITTGTWLNEEYLFRAVAGETQSKPAAMAVKIDKVKPQPPVLDQSDEETFFEMMTISGHVLPKESKIGQVWEYSLDEGKTWTAADNDSFELSGDGEYKIQVRTKDEAGNISDVDSYTMHIKNKSEQTIAFDEVPEFITYGTEATITAQLTSNPEEQAKTDLIFVIPDDSKAKVKIVSQSYDPDTGKATATLHPLNGDVFFDVEIQKAGDEKAQAAQPQKVTIALKKAPLTVHPYIVYGKIIGDEMPNLISEGIGLVNGDTLPDALSIVLTPTADTSDSLPYDAGSKTITHAGTWEMKYPENILADPALEEFVNKYYDVELLDYDDDTKYVFSVTDTGIADSYVIVSPEPNSDGWNNSPVTITLSETAKNEGWKSVILIENGAEGIHGESISLTDDTRGMMPIVILKKDDSTKSEYKSLRYVKIDQGLPSADITIDHENDWTKTDKKVTITARDAFSGVKNVSVSDSDGNTVTLTQESANTYSFVSDNESYHLIVTDYADNKFEMDFTVTKIDKTAPTITAILGALSTDESTHDIDVTATVGTSGVQSFSVYYKENASDAYPTTPSEALNPSNLTCTYQAKKNGFYLFEIVNGVGEKATAEVEVTDVVAVLPVVAIQAELDDGSHTSYTSGQWVNKDVILTLSNTNSAITEPITYQYKKASDTTWTNLDGDKLTIEESAWQNETYEFRGVISSGEGSPASINIRIDKEKPEVPTIDNAENFHKDNAFAAPLTITGSTTPKNSAIGQIIKVSKDHGITWEEMSGNSLTLTTPDAYALTFKTVDEAGNESDEFTLDDVIVNDGTPLITIKLNNNFLKDIVNHITFGYFFKDHVDVDIEVNWYGMANGDVYYILDDSANPSVPADDDPRWVSGDSTSIDPDRKTMIYAKAVNSDGKIARASSTYYVIADETPPQITFDKSYENWNKDNSLTATVTDNLSGVDNASIETRIDHSDKGDVEVKGSTLNFRSLPDGSYKLQVSAKDNSGNEANEIITVKIDTTAPNVNGVKDQSVYHQYYLPRHISVEDKHSGIAIAQITKDGGSAETITDPMKVTEIGTYKIDVKDQAGNEDTLTFQIVPLPDIETEIDCSEESRKIVEQIEQEYAESRDHMDETERNNIQKWLDDAHDIRNTCRIKIVYNEDKSAWVEGIGDVDFAMDVVLVVEDIATSGLPSLPSKARMAYNVYLKQGEHEIEPNGMVKVHLPYDESLQNPILYEINDAQKVKEITAQQNESHLIFEADTLLKYAIAQKEGNKGTNIDIDDDGCPDLNIVMTDEKGNYW